MVSEQTCRKVLDMMRGVVDSGRDGAPGRNAYVAGYDIGGKSGTSEKLDTPKIDGLEYEVASSFLAVLPLENPQIAILAVLDDPRYGKNYGSQLGAPIVGNIISEIGPYLGLERTAQENSGTVRVPNLVGNAEESGWPMAQVALNKCGLNHRVLGGGPEVLWQYPYAGENVPLGTTVYLYTESTQDTKVEVPDVLDRPAEQAVQILQAASLNVQVSGPPNGTVSIQSQSPGASVPMGTIVTVTTVDQTVPE